MMVSMASGQLLHEAVRPPPALNLTKQSKSKHAEEQARTGECQAACRRKVPTRTATTPIGGHFRAISERVMLGETLDGALWRVGFGSSTAPMDFLAICISIQVETGGSLSDALNNLADLLRQRRQG